MGGKSIAAGVFCAVGHEVICTWVVILCSNELAA